MTQATHPGAPWPDAFIQALIVTANLNVEPVAVFDFDNTCIDGDIGEALHVWLCVHGGYDLDGGGFFAALGDCPSRPRLEAAWQQHRATGADQVPDALVRDLAAVYLRHLRRCGIASTYQWACTLHAGMAPEQVAAATRALLLHELGGGAGQWASALDGQTPTPDGIVLRAPASIRLRPAIERLLRFLHGQGFVTWVCSATNAWAIEEAAPLVGFSAKRVIANRCVIDAEARIGVDRDGPTTWRAGKCEALGARFPDGVHLSLGDSMGDLEMLQSAPLAVLVDRGDAVLRGLAEEAGWHVVEAQALQR